MYRNFGNQGRGNPPYPNRETGSPHTGSSNPASLMSTISTQSTTQQEQKFTMAGSSQFVPSLNAITTNQDLQWLVQPLVPPPGPSQSPRPHYPTLPGARPLIHGPSQAHLFRPGVIRAASHSVGSTRRRNDEHLSSEELERRKVRRERNKLAAAKCRNRRRELTDTLQAETDDLEGEKSLLQKEIAELEKQKDKLQLILEAHRPICKIEESDSDSDHSSVLPSLRGVKMEPKDADLPGPSKRSQTKPEKPKPKITLPVKPVTSSASAAVGAESEALHTPVLMSTPSLTPFTASMIFTYPSGSLDTTASLLPMAAPASSTSLQPRNPQPCGIAHRRSSSSGDQSDHSLHSPTILTL